MCLVQSFLSVQLRAFLGKNPCTSFLIWVCPQNVRGVLTEAPHVYVKLTGYTKSIFLCVRPHFLIYACSLIFHAALFVRKDFFWVLVLTICQTYSFLSPLLQAYGGVSLFTWDFFFLIETVFCSCYPGWSAMARSRLTATSASWVQAILLPQPPE